MEWAAAACEDPGMPTSTAEELIASIGGLSPALAQDIAQHIDECRVLLTSGTSMDSVQQHLKDQDVPIIQAVLITTRLIGNDPGGLRAAREIVECSPARTPTPPTAA